MVLLGNAGVGKTVQLRALQSNGRLAGVPEPAGGVPSSSAAALRAMAGAGGGGGAEAGAGETGRGGGGGGGGGGGDGGGEQLRDMRYVRTMLPTPGRTTLTTEKEICQMTCWDMCAARMPPHLPCNAIAAAIAIARVGFVARSTARHTRLKRRAQQTRARRL